jgi:formate hydrogenlyase subunit 6/NADH:ubiquinone oxidoreductase subunit I
MLSAGAGGLSNHADWQTTLAASPQQSYNRSPMAKKKLPKVLALLDEDMCTGCEACMTVCPVDCISVIPGPRHEGVYQICTIDLPRCIGCTLCHQVCPWDCITMIPTDQFLQNEQTAPQLT